MKEKNMQNKRKLLVPVSETGHLIGEAHPNAKLTDKQVALMLVLREEWGMRHATLAWIFGVSKETVKSVCNYRRRSCTVMGHKAVYVTD